MAGVVGSNPTRPTTLCYGFRNNILRERLFMTSLWRYLTNQARPTRQQEPLEKYPHGKYSIFLSYLRDEKLTYPKPATSRLTGDQ
jgi:hypothetical protein